MLANCWCFWLWQRGSGSSHVAATYRKHCVDENGRLFIECGKLWGIGDVTFLEQKIDTVIAFIISKLIEIQCNSCGDTKKRLLKVIR